MKNRLFAIAAAVLALVACKHLPEEIAVTGVKLSKSSIELTAGESARLEATVLPSNASNKGVKWASAVPNVASVSSDGTVSALEMGATTITVTTEDGGFKATCAVIVKKKVIPVQSVSLNLPSITLTEGGSVILGATISPANADDRSVTWSATPESVVTVKQDGHNGIVTAVGPGEGTVTVTTSDGGFQASCKVTVEAATIDVESVTLDKESLELKEGETATLTATVLPENATDKTVSWKSTNPDVATVDEEGNVTAIQAGQASITASSGGKEATCQVTVSKIEVDGVTVTPATLELVEGDVFQLSASVSPAEADQTVEWASMDEAIAKVGRNDGLVTAVSAGSTRIFARSKAFPEQQGYCNITVTPDPTLKGIELSSAIMTLQVGESRTLTVNYTPSYAANKNVSWASSNPSVAAVDKDGTVTAFAEGNATVTATAEDGGHTASCEVTVSGSAGPMVFYDLYDGRDFVPYINGAPDPRNGIYDEESLHFAGGPIAGAEYYGGILYTIEEWSGLYQPLSYWLCKDRKPAVKLSLPNGNKNIRDFIVRDDWFAILVSYPGFEKLSVFRFDYSGGCQETVLDASSCSFRRIYNPGMVCLPDGTLRVAGRIEDAYFSRYIATYDIPAGSSVPGNATLLDKNDVGEPRIATDSNGVVYILVQEYAPGGSHYNIILYKNGVRFQVVDKVEMNYDGAIACRDGHVYYAVSDSSDPDLTHIRVYKDDTLLYTIQDKRLIYYYDVRPMRISAAGDVYLVLRGDDTALYKNGSLLYSDSWKEAFNPYCIIE